MAAHSKDLKWNHDKSMVIPCCIGCAWEGTSIAPESDNASDVIAAELQQHLKDTEVPLITHEQKTNKHPVGRWFVSCSCGWESGMSHASEASADKAWMLFHLAALKPVN